MFDPYDLIIFLGGAGLGAGGALALFVWLLWPQLRVLWRAARLDQSRAFEEWRDGGGE